MHGMTSHDVATERAAKRLPGFAGDLFAWIRAHRNWALLVLLPTLLVAAYYYLIAADQYETEAHFLVRSATGPSATPSGLNQAMTLVGGGSTPSRQDAMVVADYLTSHDAVAALKKRMPLEAMFRRPEADPVSRLWSADPAPETLLKFFNRQVNVQVSTETDIATLRVRAFRPADALAISQQLLQLSEARVNAINQRNYNSAVAMSQRQVAEAEANVNAIQQRITAFRRGTRDFSPSITGQARTAMVSQLQARLAVARAQEAAMAAALAPNSPQLVAMRERVAALAREAAVEESRMASGPGNVATGLGTFEALQLRQQLAGKQYETASSALQRAREDASRQQLFLVRVVDPNLPVKSLYPKRPRIILTVFLTLLLAYGIGWLIAAGVREHSL